MSTPPKKPSREEQKEVLRQRREALLDWLKIIRTRVKLGVVCNESFIGIVNFSKRSRLSLTLYKIGTSITREATAQYVLKVTGDILEAERRGGDQYQFLKDRCFAVRIKPNTSGRSTPEHHFSMVNWKEEISYNTADHFMTIKIDLETPMENSEKTRLFGKVGTIYRP